jgi:hypothetical protein
MWARRGDDKNRIHEVDEMRTNLKVILATIGIAVLASPVMAHSERHHHHATRSTPGVSGTYGYIAPAPIGPVIGVMPLGGGQVRVNDCIHTTFPQCGQ